MNAGQVNLKCAQSPAKLSYPPRDVDGEVQGEENQETPKAASSRLIRENTK
jgi:hypothetical protein